jgi:glycosyltransferase involved in cell wall biosynthesis
VEATRLLNREGVRAELTVLGVVPPGEPPDFVRVVPFITKTSPSGVQRLADEIARSHFLLAPSRADCAPVSIAEASAYAVPTLASDVGGMASIVTPGRNGELLAAGATPAQLAERIATLMGDQSVYEDLALGAYAAFRDDLNWSVAVARFAALAGEVPT